MNLTMKFSEQQIALLRRALRTSLIGGLTFVLLPILDHVFATAIHHSDGGSVIRTIIEHLGSHLDFLLAVFLLGMLGGAYWFLFRNLHRLSLNNERECSREELAQLLTSFQNADFKTRLPDYLTSAL